eukprot:PhF_6_TR5768/c0_g1_i2/m.8508
MFDWNKEVDVEAMCMICGMAPTITNADIMRQQLEHKSEPLINIAPTQLPTSPSSSTASSPRMSPSPQKSGGPTNSPPAILQRPPPSGDPLTLLLPDARTIQAAALHDAEKQRSTDVAELLPPLLGMNPFRFFPSSTNGNKVATEHRSLVVG